MADNYDFDIGAIEDEEEEQLEPLRTRKLTAIETAALEAKRQEHRNNITRTYVVMKKEFTGTAFIPTPPVIEFKDFELGKRYNQRIKLTNVSWTFNTFKLLPLKDEIKDFFVISYSLPGKMSAGVSCDIDIEFTPRLLQDIEDELPILAYTGPVSIPIRCYTKKVVISVSPYPVIDIGLVMLAEHRTAQLKISNAGALETTVYLAGEAIEYYALLNNYKPPTFSSPIFGSDVSRPTTSAGTPYPEQGTSERPPQELAYTQAQRNRRKRVLKFSDRAAYIGPFSSTTIDITFYPTEVAPLETSLLLYFSDDFTDDILLKLRATSADACVFLARDIIDFYSCYYNTFYRDTLYILNRGKTAFKIMCVLYDELAFLRDYLEFVPAVGFVYTDNPLNIYIKFSPKEGILEKFGNRYFNHETGCIEVPIQVLVPDQSFPVYFMLKARVTSSRLEITPNIIDFGKVSVEEVVYVPITIKNHSILPYQFGFVKTIAELSVYPNDGFAEILPGETLDFKVSFSPYAAVEYLCKLICKNARNEEFLISCMGHGVATPIKFLPGSLMQLSSVGLGDFVTYYLDVYNYTQTQYAFKFMIPEGSNVTLEPKEGILKAREKRAIMLKFHAPKVVDEYYLQEIEQKYLARPSSAQPKSPRATGAAASAASPGKAGVAAAASPSPTQAVEAAPAKSAIRKFVTQEFYEDWEKSEPGAEAWSRHKNIVIPCFVHKYPLRAMYLEVQTTVVTSTLILVDNLDNYLDYLDFGEVAIFYKLKKSFIIRNISGTTTTLSINPQLLQEIEESYFFLVKPPKTTLRPGEEDVIVVEFNPVVRGTFEYNFQVRSTLTNRAQLPLRGVGLHPVLTLEPSDRIDLHIGHVVVNGEAQKTVTLVNHTDINVPFYATFPGEDVHPFNRDGTGPFEAYPANGIIAANSKQYITIKFKPDHEFKNYRAIFKVRYGGDQHTRYLGVTGGGWNQGSFVIFDSDEEIEKIQKDEELHVRRMNEFERWKKDEGAKVKPGEDVFYLALKDIRAVHSSMPKEDPFAILYKASPVSLSAQDKDARQRYEHTFSQVRVGESKQFKFQLGLALADTNAKNAKSEFVFNTAPTDKTYGWSVEPAKGALVPGSLTTATVSFAPTKDTLSLIPVPGVSVWTETSFDCVVKDPVNTAGKTFSFTMRGYAEQGSAAGTSSTGSTPKKEKIQRATK